MELRQLQQFSAVVEEESFADAAMCLDLQSARISASIRSLARELGNELFTPGAHGPEPTDAGYAPPPAVETELFPGVTLRRRPDGRGDSVQLSRIA
jgi:hypothetical protein